MTLVPALRRASVAAILFLGASAAQAAVSFHVSVTTEREKFPGVKSRLPAQEVEENDVVLGQQYISVSDGKTLSVLDFSTRRRYVIDKAAGTYEQYSLFDVVGQRQSEMRHRLGIADVLTLAKRADHVTPQAYEEQALSVRAGKVRGRLVPNILDGEVLWSLDEHPLLRLGPAHIAGDGQDSKAFAQFLRYTWGGHPLVLKMFADSRQIPMQFLLYYREVGGKLTRRFRVSGVQADAPATFTLQGYRPGRAGAGAPLLERVLDQATRLQPLAAEAHPAMRAQAEQAFAGQRPFAALLIMMEDNYSTGAPVGKLSPQQRLALETNEQAQQLIRALSARDEDAIKAGLAAIQALRAQVGKDQPMLTLFEASMRGKAGQWPEAIALHLEALQARPQLAGGYKELGDALYAQFDTANAWRSWEAGRTLVPTHRLFASVNRREQELLTGYPVFFESGAPVQPSTSRPASSTNTAGSTNLP
ncbi:hypothetical protein O3301_12420 [Janthinobacterium sp. SUN211]|uniref:hypothetical protein n=1 Tax=Janthinobacterium sp. SUN211 TaxID=3014786 RepID=UPI0027129FC4|nr:hypothetical protein [Janthinobacterium sp. SUN211]MDO8049268.1 hypothetical protein [Janthinobacterium sp. SUN211]